MRLADPELCLLRQRGARVEPDVLAEGCDGQVVVPPREVDVGGLVEVAGLGPGCRRALGHGRGGWGGRGSPARARGRGRRTPARGRSHLELQRERVDTPTKLVDPTLKLPCLAPEVVAPVAQASQAALELGQRLSRATVAGLDLGQEGGTRSLDLLLHPQEVRPKPVSILVKKGGRLRSAPSEEGDRPEDGGETAPPPPRRHSADY